MNAQEQKNNQKQKQQQQAQYQTNMLTLLSSLSLSEPISKPKSSPSPLQQQLQSLSLSYKNAQSRLLALQKQLYAESVTTQKQKSIIQILKYTINGNMDYQSIFGWLNDMAQEEEQAKEQNKDKDIIRILEEVKGIVKNKRESSEKQAVNAKVVIEQLKRDIGKLKQVKRELMEDLDNAINQKGDLQTKIYNISTQKQELLVKNQQLRSKLQLLEQKQINLQVEKESMIMDIQQKDKIIQHKDKIIRQKQQFVAKISSEFQKANKQSDQNSQICILKQINKLTQKLQKYRKISKQLSDKIQSNKQNNNLLSSIKLFLPEQALGLCQQFEKSGQKCLLKQLEQISKLQHKKYQQLEMCHQQLWLMKSKILFENECSNLKTKRTLACTQRVESTGKQNVFVNSASNEKENYNFNQNFGRISKNNVTQFQFQSY